jgi:hypothetical protein
MAKIKSGREHAIDMLTTTREYQKAQAPQKWVDGMIRSWIAQLLACCTDDSCREFNEAEIPEEVKAMVADYVYRAPQGIYMTQIQKECTQYGVITQEAIDLRERMYG